jgi:hypothetical protein
MAGIIPNLFGNADAGSGGVLPFGPAPLAQNPVDANRNAILGYLAGALQGGNLGQAIARGLQGSMHGSQTDAAQQAQRAAMQYVGQRQDIDPALRSALMQNPQLAMHYLLASGRPHVTGDIADYEYARKQGFPGTFTDFVQRKHGRAPLPAADVQSEAPK